MKNQGLHKQAHDPAFGSPSVHEYSVQTISQGSLLAPQTIISRLSNETAIDNQAVLHIRPFKHKRVVDHPLDFLL